jgi:FkbM family methyltransferase
MALKFRRLAGALLPESPEAQDLRRRLSRADEAIDYWKKRFERRGAAVDRLKQAVEDSRQHLSEVQAQVALHKHRELSPAVLQQILPVRAQHRPVLASDAAAADDRERRHMMASSEYLAAINDEAARMAALQRCEVLGIPWWLPRDEAKAGRVTKLQRQGFPLRVILQTREVALGGIMLDLGANVGRTSVTRMLLGDVRAVYAAEPEPTNYACLVQNVVEHRLRGFVLPDRVAIGAHRGEVKLRRSAYVGGHRLLNPARRQRAPIETVLVQLWPVDEWMARLGIEPEAVSFVKVDTQGSEVNVLRGARALLARRHVAWQIEVDPGLLTRAGAAVEELLQLIAMHFTHFIDLGTGAGGPRSRPTRDLAGALSYVGGEQAKTDLVVYNAAS